MKRYFQILSLGSLVGLISFRVYQSPILWNQPKVVILKSVSHGTSYVRKETNPSHEGWNNLNKLHENNLTGSHNSTIVGTPMLALTVSSVAISSTNNTEGEINISMADDERPSCHRYCPKGRVNKVVYLGQGQAGLQDRGAIVNQMMQLAGYLCADFYMRPPAFHLGRDHNDMNLISENVTWSDFWQSHHLTDGSSPALVELSVPTNWTGMPNNPLAFTVEPRHMEQLKTMLSYPVNSIGTEHPSSASSSVTMQPAHAQLEMLLSRPGKNQSTQELEEHLRMAHEISNYTNGQERTFLWGINFNFYSYWPAVKKQLALWAQAGDTSVPPFGTDPKDGCQYAVKSQSPLITDMAERVWLQLEHEHPNVKHIGHFHIRRGDAVEQCNTTLARLQDYLDCSLSNVTSDKNELLILLGSDERDPIYRQAIGKLTRGIPVVDLDALVLEEVKRSLPPSKINNYLVFAVNQGVSSKVHFRLVARRRQTGQCPTCTNVAQQLLRL